jgi:uncharacterized protein (DUF433 family)
MSSTTPRAYKDYQWVVQDPELIGGHLAIRGTRLPVSLILECLASGFDLDEILKQYPTFPREALTEVFKVAADVTGSITKSTDAA